jgi:hypothetical protein
VIDVTPADGGSFAANIDTAWQMPLEDAGPYRADKGAQPRPKADIAPFALCHTSMADHLKVAVAITPAVWRYSSQSAGALVGEKHNLDQRRRAVMMNDISVSKYGYRKRGQGALILWEKSNGRTQ